MPKVRAIIRHNKKTGYFVVLCPLGHLLTSRKADHTFGGSWFEAEMGQHQAGRETSFDRQAAACQGAGH